MDAGGASGKVVGLRGKLPGKPYRVAIGRDFSVQEIEARTAYGTARTRDFIARMVIGCLAVAIGYSAAMGVLRDDWSYLRVVWVPAGPWAR
jgi:hypothetical protein